jgi:hypothetical protein
MLFLSSMKVNNSSISASRTFSCMGAFGNASIPLAMLEKVKTEWELVSVAHNFKKLATDRPLTFSPP